MPKKSAERSFPAKSFLDSLVPQAGFQETLRMRDGQLMLNIGLRIKFVYRNWRGEVAERRVVVTGIGWGKTEWHPEPGWLLEGHDIEKGEYRFFAMNDMTDVRRDQE